MEIRELAVPALAFESLRRLSRTVVHEVSGHVTAPSGISRECGPENPICRSVRRCPYEVLVNQESDCLQPWSL